MRNPEKSKEYFAKPGTVSRWWEPTEGDKSHIFQRQLELLENMLLDERGLRTLDIACGKGRVSQVLIRKGFETYSLDISQEMLDIAQERQCIQRPVLGDAENLPFEDDYFDIVVCLDALVHIPDPLKTIKEAYRVIKQGGCYIVNTSNPYDLGFIPRKLSEYARRLVDPKSKRKGEGIFQYISPNKIRSLIEEAGFTIEKEKTQGLLAPIEIRFPNGRDVYLFSGALSKRLDRLDQILEKIPILNKLCISAIYKARK